MVHTFESSAPAVPQKCRWTSQSCVLHSSLQVWRFWQCGQLTCTDNGSKIEAEIELVRARRWRCHEAHNLHCHLRLWFQCDIAVSATVFAYPCSLCAAELDSCIWARRCYPWVCRSRHALTKSRRHRNNHKRNYLESRSYQPSASCACCRAVLSHIRGHQQEQWKHQVRVRPSIRPAREFVAADRRLKDWSRSEKENVRRFVHFSRESFPVIHYELGRVDLPKTLHSSSSRSVRARSTNMAEGSDVTSTARHRQCLC